MIVWRVTRRAHKDEPLSGEGARLYGGRWNHAGVPVAYTSQSLSLAVLEYLVNVSIADLPDDLFSVRIEIPNSLKRLEIVPEKLPATWRTYPAPEAVKDIGTEWIKRGDTRVLVVPSVVIPSERNCLINPRHPLARRIVVDRVERFSMDERLFRRPKQKK